jgi:hypothetical protein
VTKKQYINGTDDCVFGNLAVFVEGDQLKIHGFASPTFAGFALVERLIVKVYFLY